MAIALPGQPIVFIMYLTEARDRLCKDVLACTTSAVADGAVDQIRQLQSELKVNLWADSKKKNTVFGCSVVCQWLRVLVLFETCCSLLCFHVLHDIYLIMLHLKSSLLFR